VAVVQEGAQCWSFSASGSAMSECLSLYVYRTVFAGIACRVSAI
jgi:hypothetical protein